MLKILLCVSFFSIFLYSEPISPIPTRVEINHQKALLGSKLFFDTRLSKDGTVSCATCHNLELGGVDRLPFSVGINGGVGNINAPTVFNSVFNLAQFWDGRAKDLKEQAGGPIENPLEMGNSFENLINTLNKTEYKDQFLAIYKEGITRDSITDALSEFQKSLITPNSSFDRYLRGDKNALSKEQQEGYELFKTHGCIACHHGVNVGGNLYAKFGVVQALDSDALGRFNVTKEERDRYYFKVPTLRNIELTPPYLHDGSINSLSESVKFMSHYQLGKTLSEEEIERIVDFLKSLTGDVKYYETPMFKQQ